MQVSLLPCPAPEWGVGMVTGISRGLMGKRTQYTDTGCKTQDDQPGNALSSRGRSAPIAEIPSVKTTGVKLLLVLERTLSRALGICSQDLSLDVTPLRFSHSDGGGPSAGQRQQFGPGLHHCNSRIDISVPRLRWARLGPWGLTVSPREEIDSDSAAGHQVHQEQNLRQHPKQLRDGHAGKTLISQVLNHKIICPESRGQQVCTCDAVLSV